MAKSPPPRKKSKVARRPAAARPAASAPKRVAASAPLTRSSDIEIDNEALIDAEAHGGRGAVSSGMMIVGVGASAGGLEAFTELLEAAPVDAGLAFVFIQHLSPNHVSSLPSLLSTHTTMPVVEVIDGAHVKANHVYVIPPNVQMALIGDTLQLTPRGPGRRAPTPIDGFFLSLAEIACERAIGVVLSGTGSDGSLGLRDLKACGGITFAQLPQSAKFDGMPRAAINTGMVDLVMTPAQIGTELRAISMHPYVGGATASEPPEVDDDHLRRVFALLRPVSGVDFTHYKQPTIRRRLLRRMAVHRLQDIRQYLKLLQSDPREAQGLFQDLLIHVTGFFREPESFAAVAEDVFPRLMEGRDPEHPIRVWVCGCATGEEAYSLAIELLDFFEREHLKMRAQIFATDVSDRAIEFARAGVFPPAIAAAVPEGRLRRYFTQVDGNFRVNQQIRELCVFARQDLTKDPAFSRLDLVMCRNVLIYMDTVLQRKLMGVFHYALQPEGFLVLGQAESIGHETRLFTLVDKRHRIHRKKLVPGLPVALQAAAADHARAGMARVPATPPKPDAEATLQGEVSKLILDRYAPPGVVVDADLQIVQFRGQTGPFLEASPGDASLGLVKMLRDGLLYAVRSAVDETRKTQKPARRDGLQVRVERRWLRLSVVVAPIGAGGRPHYLVLFDRADHEAAEPLATKPAKKRHRAAPATPARIATLQKELDSSRQYLQSIIQELEAANEELQSANEEILSSNEELQSTNEELDTAKEELQSTNEELNTVNDELQARNDELSRANGDLVNLVGSIHIAIVIVGNDLRVRRFTAMAEKVLNLIPADLNRSIAHINPDIDCPNLPQLIIECIDTITPVEREVRDHHGRWYSLRIRPYKGIDNKIDGAVLALFDIDVLKRSEQSMQRAHLFADALLEESSEPVALLESDFTINKVNEAFAELFHTQPTSLIGRSIADASSGGWDLSSWSDDANRFTPGRALPTLTIKARDASMIVNARAVPAPDSAAATLLMVSVTYAPES